MSVRELFNANQYNLFCKDLTLSGDLEMSGDLILDEVHVINTSNSTSVTTGALVVAGGVGIVKDMYVGGTIYGNITGSVTTTSLSLSDTTQSTNTATGTLIVSGGAGIAKNLYTSNCFVDQLIVSWGIGGNIYGTFTGYLERWGNSIFIYFNGYTDENIGTAATIYAGLIPEGLRPSADTYFSLYVIDNDITFLSKCIVQPDGTIVFYSNTEDGKFGTSGNNGFKGGVLIYHL